MAVRIVTDSTACLPEELARAWDITVLPIHAMTADGEQTTAGLNALELTAAYARQLERGGDDGVVAIHLSKALSSTWSAAVTASGVFDGLVKVVDTDGVGMILGEAALRAARAAREGADLATCAAAAESVTGHNHLWLYVHRADVLRRSGRLSTKASLMTQTLPVKPIFSLTDGAFQVAARTRTQVKALDRLVELIIEAAGAEPATVCVHQAEGERMARTVADRLGVELPAGSEVSITEITEAVKVHTGPGAIAVSLVRPAAASL